MKENVTIEDIDTENWIVVSICSDQAKYAEFQEMLIAPGCHVPDELKDKIYHKSYTGNHTDWHQIFKNRLANFDDYEYIGMIESENPSRMHKFLDQTEYEYGFKNLFGDILTFKGTELINETIFGEFIATNRYAVAIYDVGDLNYDKLNEFVHHGALTHCDTADKFQFVIDQLLEEGMTDYNRMVRSDDYEFDFEKREFLLKPESYVFIEYIKHY